MGKTKPKKKTAKPGHKEVAEADVNPHCNIYVGNLPSEDFSEGALRQLFDRCGHIADAKLVSTAKHTFGFVEFSTVSEAELAIETMNGESGMLVKFAKNTSNECSGAPTSVPQPATAVIDKEDDDEKDGEQERQEDEESEEAICKEEHESEFASVPELSAAEARSAAARDYPNPVESLQALVQRATRATSTLDYITYIIDEDEFGIEYVGRVEVRAVGRLLCHSGEPKQSKKDAKVSAARCAMRDLTLHRLLPPLPARPKESKSVRTVVSDDESEVEKEELSKPIKPVGSTKTPQVSAAKQKQLEKERRAAKRKAAAAVKAAALAEMMSKEDSSEEESEGDSESEEETSDEEVTSTEVDSEEDEDD